jgi:hypothetical protein
MLLHASNYSLCLYGMDIDYHCVSMTKINGALYSPWLSFPFPAAVLTTTPAAAPKALPLPPPAPLLPPEQMPVEPVMRVDDRGQGLLFDEPVRQRTPRQRRAS